MRLGAPLVGVVCGALGLAAACADDAASGGGAAGGAGVGAGVELPAPLAALPPIAPAEGERFVTHMACAQCHEADAEGPMHDQDGLDVSPVSLWRPTMMAFASRDPFYLATVSEELARVEGDAAATELVETACTRCHAPAAALEHERAGGHVSWDEIVAQTTPLANLARDGVTCSMCHQIGASNLGTPASFGGGFQVGFDRAIFGPHQGPKTDPMQFFVDYTPTYSAHVATSELCATCHTVETPVLGADGQPTGETFLEQAPYLEWKNASASQSGSCGTCHLPGRDSDGSPLASPLAKYPTGLAAREPYGRHSFVGANAYMLGLLADNVAWTGSDVPASELEAAAARNVAHLEDAAELALEDAGLDGDVLEIAVTVSNRTGHKLPTGYPGRRVFLHLVARAADDTVLFESGAVDGRGAILGGGGAPIDVSKPRPHAQVIDAPDVVPIWEALAVDASGALATRPLAAVRYGKDNRILPSGWSDADPWIARIKPVGTAGDDDFGPGSDRVRYRIAGGSSVARVEVELLYQTTTPEALDRLAIVPTPAAVRFSQMAAARAPAPIRMASAELTR